MKWLVAAEFWDHFGLMGVDLVLWAQIVQIMGYNQDVISFVFIDKHIENRVTEVVTKSSYT